MPGLPWLRNPLCGQGSSHPRLCPNRQTGKVLREAWEWRGRGAAARLWWRRAPSLSELPWSLLLHMALVFQIRRPVGAQPLPGQCQGEPTRTGAGGKWMLACWPLLAFSVVRVAGKENGPRGASFLSCSVLLARSSWGVWQGNCNVEPLTGEAEGP